MKGLEEAQRNEIISYLIDSGYLLKISDNIYFSTAAMEKGKALLAEYSPKKRNFHWPPPGIFLIPLESMRFLW